MTARSHIAGVAKGGDDGSSGVGGEYVPLEGNSC